MACRNEARNYARASASPHRRSDVASAHNIKDNPISGAFCPW